MATKTAIGTTSIEALLKEKRKYPPPKEFAKRANVNRASVYAEAAKNPVRFWERFARELDWFKPWRKALEWKAPYAKWFIGGKLNVSYNCLDRHINTARRPNAALAVLGCTRIGARHSVIFGGFAAGAIRERIHDAQAAVLVTADGGGRRGG